mmetsp:Transcript_1046/g.1424  ORF Transcript_1046/g.1424 Transcript_1046/m.1424 type:complete len:205 (-) Transcript_1046:1722-2336(-)
MKGADVRVFRARAGQHAPHIGVGGRCQHHARLQPRRVPPETQLAELVLFVIILFIVTVITIFIIIGLPGFTVAARRLVSHQISSVLLVGDFFGAVRDEDGRRAVAGGVGLDGGEVAVREGLPVVGHQVLHVVGPLVHTVLRLVGGVAAHLRVDVGIGAVLEHDIGMVFCILASSTTATTTDTMGGVQRRQRGAGLRAKCEPRRH